MSQRRVAVACCFLIAILITTTVLIACSSSTKPSSSGSNAPASNELMGRVFADRGIGDADITLESAGKPLDAPKPGTVKSYQTGVFHFPLAGAPGSFRVVAKGGVDADGQIVSGTLKA